MTEPELDDIPPVPSPVESYDWSRPNWTHTENGLKVVCHPDASDSVYVDGERERSWSHNSDVPIDVYVHSWRDWSEERVERIFHKA